MDSNLSVPQRTSTQSWLEYDPTSMTCLPPPKEGGTDLSNSILYPFPCLSFHPNALTQTNYMEWREYDRKSNLFFRFLIFLSSSLSQNNRHAPITQTPKPVLSCSLTDSRNPFQFLSGFTSPSNRTPKTLSSKNPNVQEQQGHRHNLWRQHPRKPRCYNLQTLEKVAIFKHIAAYYTMVCINSDE